MTNPAANRLMTPQKALLLSSLLLLVTCGCTNGRAINATSSAPPAAPADLALPIEGQPGTTVDTDFYAAWAPAKACPIDVGGGERTTMETDARRTAFRAATQSAGASKVWQVAVYPDKDTAHRAYQQLFDAIDRCTTGAQSDRLPRNDINADEAFVKTFHRPAGRIGDRTASHHSFTVARVGTTIIAHELDEKEVPIRDPRAKDEPTAVAMKEFLQSLCDRHHRCRG